jgi:hypothetical protein
LRTDSIGILRIERQSEELYGKTAKKFGQAQTANNTEVETAFIPSLLGEEDMYLA